MNNDKTLQEQIESLKMQSQKDVERKVRELTIKEEIQKVTGLEFMVLIHSGKTESISIWIDNDRFGPAKFDRFEMKKYYDAICTIYKPECKNITFASSKEIENFAPVKLEFENNTSEIVFDHPQTVKFAFYFEGNITVSFKCPVNSMNRVFSNDILGVSSFELKPYNKNKMRKTLYFLDMFGKVNMYGNDYYIYCEYQEQLEEFMSVVFYGHIPEFVEGFLAETIS